MSRVGAATAAAVLATVWLGPVAAAGQPSAPPSTNDVPISVDNATSPMPDPDTIAHLASTGADVTSMFRTGIAMLVAGALAVGLARRPGGTP
jgi:hypothetical protein